MTRILTSSDSTVPRPAGLARPEVLLAILTDLSVDHRCHKWARSLRDAGYEPVICCDRPLNPLGTAWDGFDIRILTQESHQRRFLPNFVAFLWRLTGEMRRTKAKVWISLDAPPLFWLALWGKLRGRRVVYDSHELYLETPLVLNRPSRRIFWTLWERGGFALIRHAVTVSPAIRDRLKADHPHVKFHVLPNMPLLPKTPAVFPEANPPSKSEREAGEFRLVFQGGLRVATGLPELFVALAERPGLRKMTLDVYGGGPEEAWLKTAAQVAGLMKGVPELHGEARVRFHGSVPFETIPARMAEAHVGIHLMQPVCGSFALTWANKTFDYAQAGLPVLLSDNPAHKSLLERYPVGVLADSFSPEAIGRALETLVAEYDRHASAARAARTEWHWGAAFRDLPEFLDLG